MNNESSKTVKSYSIQDIASWQEDLNLSKKCTKDDFKISLPTLQRGFVWKPYQIESLWDSILRGYPVGAVLMNQSGNVKELLDGQQRSTSIALGFFNPLLTEKDIQIFNLKKSIPTIWLDMKVKEISIDQMKFGVRVLTRSHPWGYQLNNHRQTLSSGDRERALLYFREKIQDKTVSFSELPNKIISPWDSNYPVPLSFLLGIEESDFTGWKKALKKVINSQLKEIKTKYCKTDEYVNYDNLDNDDFQVIYDAVFKAKELLIPEILVQKETLEEETNDETGDATLFVRLNSEGTRISGEELIYSLLKATFPEAKELVEKIGTNYIAPSRIVNIFARLSLMEINGFISFQKEMNVATFRRSMKDEKFVSKLKQYINTSERGQPNAKELIDKAIDIIRHDNSIPEIYIKEIISGSSELLLVVIAYLLNNNDNLDDFDERIHKDYHSLAIFNTDIKKTARRLFNILNENDFNSWSHAVNLLRENHYEVALPLMDPLKFEDFILKYIIPEFLKNGKTHFSNYDFLKSIISSNKESLNHLFFSVEKDEYLSEEQYLNKQLELAVIYWKNLSEIVFWEKSLLVLVQRNYFKREFQEYMEFDGIQDTNRPWDWDHIYPNSWVSSKRGISDLVRWLVNTTGNFRALSFNENRSQSNHESPSFRFNNNRKAQIDSFILENDLSHWVCLTNDDKRLLDSDDKVDEFVYAVFKRMMNIYKDIHKMFGC